jgi:hypothetical protein
VCVYVCVYVCVCVCVFVCVCDSHTHTLTQVKETDFVVKQPTEGSSDHFMSKNTLVITAEILAIRLQRTCALCDSVVTMPWHSCNTLVTLSYFQVTRISTVQLLRYCCYTVVTMLSHCCYTVVKLLLHCC